MKIRTKSWILAGVVSGLLVLEFILTPFAYAIVGAPMTPVSVAGVARRTTRRVVVAKSAASTPAPAPAATGMIASLPAECVPAGDLFRCGYVYYKPYMQGGTVVYGVVPGP